MTDRPIIFSKPMVRALLDGRKTMTRRLAWRPAPKGYVATGVVAHDIEGKGRPARALATPWQRVKPGDRLWVREAWSYYGGDEMLYQRLPGAVGFRADIDTDPRLRDGRIPGGYWRPSIHMPRWASRLTLVVTAARIERLRDISLADIRAEGITAPIDWHPLHFDATDAWRKLWTELHGRESWDANPEVVALSFTVHRVNVDEERATA